MNTLSQQKAISSMVDLAIVAGPGAGKTHVIIEKIFYLIHSQNISPKKILVVTFTEKAAHELTHRLRKKLFSNASRQTQEFPWVGTIHGFAANMLTELGLLNSEGIKLLDEDLANLERIQVVRQGLIDLLEEEPEAVLFVQKYGFRKTLKLSLELLRRPHKPHFIEKLEKRYQEKKAEKKFFDFNDLEIQLLKNLENLEFRQALQSRFEWIFVDEYQDTNSTQYEIFSKIHHPEINRFVIVGDPRQAIYRFRGAKPELFEITSKKILEHGGERIFLSENFRSEDSLINDLNKIQTQLFEENFPPLIATKKNQNLFHAGFEPLILSGSGDVSTKRKEEAAVVVREIQKLLSQGIKPHEVAILFRTRKAIPFFENELKAAQIPFYLFSKEPLFAHQTALALYYFFKKCISEDSFSSLAVSYTPLQAQPLMTCPPEKDLKIFVHELLETLKPYYGIYENPQNELIFQAYEKLFLQLIDLGATSFVQLVTTLEMLRAEEFALELKPEKPKETVSLMTVHASKGLEFRVVFLADISSRPYSPERLFLLDSSEKPLFRDPEEKDRGLKSTLTKDPSFEAAEERQKKEELEESKRLLYVALSRAKELLYFALQKSDLDHSDSDKSEKRKKTNDWTSWIKRALR